MPSSDSLSGPVFHLDSWEGLHTPRTHTMGGRSSAQLTAGTTSSQVLLTPAAMFMPHS